MKKLVYSPNGWLDYIYWQKSNKAFQRELDKLTLEICQDPFGGRGNPTQLKFDLKSIWTRRLDLEHRIVYRVVNDTVQILQCRYHY